MKIGDGVKPNTSALTLSPSLGAVYDRAVLLGLMKYARP